MGVTTRKRTAVAAADQEIASATKRSRIAATSPNGEVGGRSVSAASPGSAPGSRSKQAARVAPKKGGSSAPSPDGHCLGLAAAAASSCQPLRRAASCLAPCRQQGSSIPHGGGHICASCHVPSQAVHPEGKRQQGGAACGRRGGGAALGPTLGGAQPAAAAGASPQAGRPCRHVW
jgi:hypothetical protein